MIGQDVGGFVRDAIAEPLRAEIYIGLPEALEPRVAEMVGPGGPPAIADPQIRRNPGARAEQPAARAHGAERAVVAGNGRSPPPTVRPRRKDSAAFTAPWPRAARSTGCG